MMASLLAAYLPLLIVVIVSGCGLALGHYQLLMKHKELGSEAKLPRQLVLFLLTVMSLVLIIIVTPLPEATRNQILTLMGIALSAVIALSSTSFVTNFMAAVMLRVTRPFQVGDFVTVGDLFGKVTERGLFDTEIQTENRELIAIPNATFITQSVTVARSSGVIISTRLSLGYDIGVADVEPLMLKAASASGLSGPYVHIVELGDFAVSYKICGLLTEVEGILTARSELNRQLLSAIHGAGLEIVSPTITRHITQSASEKIIPQSSAIPIRDDAVKAEDIVFDKANEIAHMESDRKALREKIRAIEESKEAGLTAEPLLDELEQVEKILRELRKEA